MDNVKLKDIRVFSGQLGLKNNNSKTLADLLPQLQANNSLKGLIVGITPKGEIIFHTSMGRFISPNPMGFARGDIISIQLAKTEKELEGIITKWQNSSLKMNDGTNIVFARRDDAYERSPSSTSNFSKKEEDVNPKASSNPSTNSNAPLIHAIKNRPIANHLIKASISYLDLSKLKSDSPTNKLLLNHLDPSKENSIEFRIVTEEDSLLYSLLRIKGQVISDNKQGRMASENKQQAAFIRTNFGIITVKDNRHLPVGHELSIKIITINNKNVSPDVTETVRNFIFNLNEDLALLKKLGDTSHISEAKSKNINHIEFIKQFSSVDAINQLDYKNIKAIIEPISKDFYNYIASMKLSAANSLASALRINTRKLRNNPQTNQVDGHQKDKLDNSDIINSVKKIAPDRISLADIIKSSPQFDILNKMSDSLSSTKEILGIMDKTQYEQENIWYNTMLPIWYDKELSQNEMFFQKTKNNNLRFIINAKFKTVGELQFDGVIGFEDASRKVVKSFDLTIRSKETISSNLCSTINTIYLNSKQITGINGKLELNNNSDFIYIKQPEESQAQESQK